MTRPRRFDYAAFRAGWRELCDLHRLDAETGQPRVFAWPAERQQPLGRPWWCDSAIFEDAGPAHSVVEAAAVANLAETARRLTGAERRLTLSEIVREALAEDRAQRMVQHLLPLRELHQARGVTVTEILGQRMEVPVKVA